MAALLTAAPGGLAASGSGAASASGSGSGGTPYQLGPVAEGPTGPTGSGGSGGSGGAPYSTAPHARSARPVETIFSASASSINAGRPVVRFQVSDRSARVRVRLAFISLLDRSTYRANLGARRTQITHSYTWSPPQKAGAGSYRVRITVRDPAGYRAVRGTTVSVSPPAPSSDHRFPVAGVHTFGGPSARFGAPRTGHTHQGQDIMAAQGTPVIAPHAGQV